MRIQRTVVILCLLGSVYLTEAFLPNGECSFLEYMASSMMCWDSLGFKLRFDGSPPPRYGPSGPYAIGDPSYGIYPTKPPYYQTTRRWYNNGQYGYRPGPPPRPPQPMRRDQSRVMAVFRQACTDGTVSFAIKCQADVDQKCKGSLMNNTQLTKIADMLCSKITYLPKLVDCVRDRHGMMLMRCVQRIPWTNKHPEMLCSMTKSMRECFAQVFSECGPILRPAMMKVFDGSIRDACTTKPQKTCSATEYTLSSAMCIAPPVMDLILPLMEPIYIRSNDTSSYGNSYYRRRPPQRSMNVAKAFKMLCKNGNWTQSVDCMKKVDNECGYSVINPVELQIVINGICRDFMTLPSLGYCMNRYTLHNMMECMLGYEYPDDGDKDNRVCHVMNHYRRCYTELFDSCADPPKSTMISMYDLFSPKDCSVTTHQAMSPSCTITEFLMAHTMCWAKLMDIVILLQKSRDNDIIEQIDMLCGHDIYEALKCHEVSEKMCGYSMVNFRSIRMAVAATCKHIKKLPLIKHCVRYIDMYSTLRCFKEITVNVLPSDMICTVTRRYFKCIAAVFRRCSDDIKQTIATYVNMLVLEPCRNKVQLYKDIEIEQLPKTTEIMEMSTMKMEGSTIKMEGSTKWDTSAGVRVPSCFIRVLFIISVIHRFI